MAQKIKEGATVVVILKDGNTDMGEIVYCDCGEMCGRNMVGVGFEGVKPGDIKVGDTVKLPGRKPIPVIQGPLPELYCNEDGDGTVCDECM